MGAIDSTLTLTKVAFTLAEDVAVVGGRSLKAIVGAAASKVGFTVGDGVIITAAKGEGSLLVRLYEKVGEITGANVVSKANTAALIEKHLALQTAHVAVKGELVTLQAVNAGLGEKLANLTIDHSLVQGELMSLEGAHGGLQSEFNALLKSHAALETKVAGMRPPLRNGLVFLKPGAVAKPSYAALESTLASEELTHSITRGQLEGLQEAHATLQKEFALLQKAPQAKTGGIFSVFRRTK